MVTAILQVKPAQTGPQPKGTVETKTQLSLILKAAKKTFSYSIAIMEKNHGLASMTEHQRVILHGRIEEEGILQPGLRISQIILKKKIVCTHLVFNIATNGTT